MILKKDKGRGVVILDTTTGIERTIALLKTEFQKSYNRSHCSHREKDAKRFAGNEI